MSADNNENTVRNDDKTTAERSFLERHRRWIYFAAALFVGMLVAFFIGRTAGSSAAEEEAEHAHGEEDGEGEETEYICPMHPEVRRDEPGTCPKCGMDLVEADEVDEEDGGEMADLTLSESAEKMARVQTEEAERVELAREVDAYGRVDTAESSDVDLTAWVDGRIEHLAVDAVGERVERGDLLAQIYSPELLSNQKTLLQAARSVGRARESGSERRERAAQSALEAAKTELRLLGMSNRQIDQTIKSGQAKEVVDVYAKGAGTVTARHVAEGDYVDTGAEILSLSPLETVWVQLELYERDLAHVDEGMRVEITVPALDDATLDERISFVDPVVDEKTRVARARVPVANPDGDLKPGMYARGHIEAPYRADADEPPVSVPDSAILWTGERSLLYVYEEGKGYSSREVTLGPKMGDRRVIEEGVEAGETVVTNGAFRIDASVEINGGDAMMGGGGAGGHDHGSGEPGGGGHGEHGEHDEKNGGDAEKVEVDPDGTEFDPPVEAEQLPDDVWYCDMGTVHYARGDDEKDCEVCGMELKHKEGDGEEHEHGEDVEEDQ